MSMNIQALLFDMDGTLVNSSSSIEQTWIKWAALHDIEPSHILKNIHGLSVNEVIQSVAPHLNVQNEYELLLEIEQNSDHSYAEIPGAKLFLEKLIPSKWGVVTMARKNHALKIFEALSLPIPEIFITADEVTHSKPHPEPYQTAAKNMNLFPEDILVFEDSIAGMTSAFHARMNVAQITFLSHVPKNQDAIYHFKDWHEVNSSEIFKPFYRD